jgi:hypothetical protein
VYCLGAKRGQQLHPWGKKPGLKCKSVQERQLLSWEDLQKLTNTVMRNYILALLFVGLYLEPLFAQVDQANWHGHIGAGFPSTVVRQEFTPSLDTLDSVQVLMERSGPSPSTPWPGSAIVTIFDGGVTGPVIAESYSVDLPAFYSGAPIFYFSEPVSLIPGRTYAFQVVSLTAGSYWLLSASSLLTGPDYPGGRLYLNGEEFVNHDLFFREGINVPEPSSLVLLVARV